MATSPARGRYVRSNVTGRVPATLEPGTFGVNWADRKLYVGDAGGMPIRFTQWLDDWDVTKFYYTGDFVIFENVVWRATDDVAPNTPFDLSNWEPITLSGRERYSEPFATASISGGVVTEAADGISVDVTAGSGVVTAYATPVDVDISEANWSAFNISVAHLTEAWGVLGVDDTGVAEVVGLSATDGAWWRAHIPLAYILWDGAEIDTIFDASAPTGGAADAIRDAYLAEGGAYRAMGLRVEAGALATLRLTPGRIFDLGINWRTDLSNPNLLDVAGQDPISFRYATRDDISPATSTSLDFVSYDSAGVLTPVPADSVTIQYVSLLAGDAFIQRGQNVYPSVDAALENLSDDWDSFVKFTAGGPPVLLAALIARDDASITGTDVRIIPAQRGEPFLTVAASTVDTSLFLPRSGSLPMTGDLDMGGFNVENAVLDGALNLIAPERLTATGASPAGASATEAFEIISHATDGKIWVRNASGGIVLAGNPVKDHNPARQYVYGDIVFEQGGLWRAPGAITPQPFDAQDWEALTGAGAASGAILQVPTAANHNVIDLNGIPSYVGLRIDGDPLQTGVLFDVPGTAAADTRSATIDALGFPNERFGSVVFRVGQATHPFSYRGQAVAYQGGQWKLSNAAQANLPAIGVIEQVIDANSFVIRTSGRMKDLQSSAFAGGTITASTRYYVSDTVPGQLTSTPSTTRPDPVLITTSTSEAIIVAGVGSSASDFVQKSGDTMDGDLTLADDAEIRFEDGTNAMFKPSTASEIRFLLGGSQAAKVEPAGTAVGDPQAVITREKGDERYIRKADIIDFLHPVGDVIVTAGNSGVQDPNNRFPGTTWVTTSRGRAIVGVGTADGLAWTAGQTRGEAEHRLTEAELAPHDHGNGTLSAASHGHSSGSLSGSLSPMATNTIDSGGNDIDAYHADGGGSKSVSISGNTGNSGSLNVSGSTSNAGGNQPHNNVQPSETFYVWERTA